MGPGLFVPADTDSTTVDQRILERSCLIRGAAVTGWAALRLHGANLCDGLASDGASCLDVPLVGQRSARKHEGVTYLRRATDPGQLTSRHGIACTTALQATVDAMCAAADLREAVVWGDVACSASLVSKPDLLAALDACRHTRGLVTAREGARLVSSRSRSPAETLMRLIWVLDARLPTPLGNWPILTMAGAWVGAPDLLGVELNVYGEYDGRDHRSRARQATDAARDWFE